MLTAISGLFLILHGLVHLLYFGQSRRLFELTPGLTWPDGAWAFSRLLGSEAARSLAAAVCVLAAAAFLSGGVALLARQPWWRAAVIGAAAISCLLFLLFWDGSLRRLDAQGAVALLINAAILAAALARWPRFPF